MEWGQTMAGDWIKVEKDTPDKPEILSLAGLLNLHPDEAFGKCFRFWRWIDSHALEGNVPCVTKNTIDALLGCAGFSEAMEKVGWLVARNGRIEIPRCDRHMGESAKQRALTAKRVASHKRQKGNAEVTQRALPREEKRREENIQEHTPADAGGACLSKRQPKAYSESFERWYAIYPRKVSKEEASASFGRALTKIMQRRGMAKEEALDWLCGVTSVFANSTAGNSGTFTPHPASWLNQGRYDDDQAEWARNRDTPVKPQESIYKPITPRRPA